MIDKIMRIIKWEKKVAESCKDESYKAGAMDMANLIRDDIKKYCGTTWIPVSDRLPEKSEYKGTSESWHLYMKRLEVAHMTDTIEYTFAYFDGCKWMDKRHQKIENVVAWKVHEPYKQV